MKKLLVLALVLSMASMANAALTLSFDATDVQVGGAVTISLSGDGGTDPGEFFLTMNAGAAGAFDISGAVLDYPGSAKAIFLDSTYAGDLGVKGDYIDIQLTDLPVPPNPVAPLNGLLVHGMVLNVGDVGGTINLVLFNTNGEVQATQDITVSDIPEPVTMGLLALGAMFIRRK
jgi:hypothetical protein